MSGIKLTSKPSCFNSNAVVEEPVVEEAVVSNDDMFKRPNKQEETVIDLSKPEIQDAEMVDDED